MCTYIINRSNSLLKNFKFCYFSKISKQELLTLNGFALTLTCLSIVKLQNVIISEVKLNKKISNGFKLLELINYVNNSGFNH